MSNQDILAANQARAAAFMRSLNAQLQGVLVDENDTVPETAFLINNQGPPGPTGPVGPEGPAGGGGSSLTLDEYTASTSGQQVRTYGNAASSSSEVYINGLRQASSSFTVSGVTITLPDTLSIEIGDLITILH